jgi:hypothetical protein
VFQPYLMLRTLAPQNMTAAQQREIDEQLGQVAAAVARCPGDLYQRAHALATRPGRDRRHPVALTRVTGSRRPFESTAMPAAAPGRAWRR